MVNTATQEFLDYLINLFPEFKSYWLSEENCFVENDGSFTLHGICAEFTSFVRDNQKNLFEESLEKLFRFIEESYLTDPDLSNALLTCFIENIAGEDVGETLKKLMGKKTLRYYEFWS